MSTQQNSSTRWYLLLWRAIWAIPSYVFLFGLFICLLAGWGPAFMCRLRRCGLPVAPLTATPVFHRPHCGVRNL